MTATISINTALLGEGKYVAGGEMWGNAQGSGVTLTYSFYGFGSGYDYGNERNSAFALSAVEKVTVRSALGVWARYANLNFVEVADSFGSEGDLRFAYSHALGSDEAAHAYYPSNHPTAGDVWFNPDHFNTDRSTIPVGSYDFLTILHELGHALGLKHSFELPNAIPAAQDNYFYSIMSYTASPCSAHGDNYASFYPTTPMYYDLLAIERMYGQTSIPHRQRRLHVQRRHPVLAGHQRHWRGLTTRWSPMAPKAPRSTSTPAPSARSAKQSSSSVRTAAWRRRERP